jgi:hypothetical protein
MEELHPHLVPSQKLSKVIVEYSFFINCFILFITEGFWGFGVLGDFSEFEGLSAAASGAYGALDKLLVEVVEAKQLHFDELVLGGLIWSAIHGVASLRLNVAQQDASKKTPLELRPSQAIVAMSDHLEANLKIMIDGLLGQSS